MKIKSPKKILDIERDLLSLMLNYPQHIELVYKNLATNDFQSENLGKIFGLIQADYNVNGEVSVNNLIDMLEDKSLVSEKFG
jgi:replicative DNA helicase